MNYIYILYIDITVLPIALLHILYIAYILIYLYYISEVIEKNNILPSEGQGKVMLI